MLPGITRGRALPARDMAGVAAMAREDTARVAMALVLVPAVAEAAVVAQAPGAGAQDSGGLLWFRPPLQVKKTLL